MMKPLRVLALFAACLAGLWPVAGFAAPDSNRSSSRSYGSRDSRSGGRYRVIDDQDESEREQKAKEQAQKREEEKKAKAEEKKKAQEEKKAEAEAKKQALEAKRQEALAKASQTPKTPAAKGEASSKADAEAKEKEAAALLAKAKEQFDNGELMGGVALLRQAIAEFGGAPSAESAERQLGYLMGQDQYGPAILLAEAEESFQAERYRRAQNEYIALLEKFPQSEQAAEAQKRLAEIQAGDLLSKTKYTEEELEDARLWLLAGNIHLENGRRTDALASYRKAIEGYPGCPYAQQAEGKVAALRQ